MAHGLKNTPVAGESRRGWGGEIPQLLLTALERGATVERKSWGQIPRERQQLEERRLFLLALTFLQHVQPLQLVLVEGLIVENAAED